MTHPSFTHGLVEKLLEGKEFSNIYNVGGNLNEGSFPNTKINNLATFETESKVPHDSLIKKIQGSEKRLSDLYQSILQNEDASLAGIELLIVNSEIDYQLISPLVKFNYFLVLPNHLKQLPNFKFWNLLSSSDDFTLFSKKHLLASVDENTFVVTTPTYDRRPQRDTEPLLKRCIQTVLSQRYPKRIHLIVGDRFQDEQLFNTITGSDMNIVSINLPFAMERELVPFTNKMDLWWNGGMNAVNYSVWLVKQTKGIIARLDDDDFWNSEHLNLMAKQYEKEGEKCAFVFCNDWEPPSNNYPIEGKVYHSSVSWRPALLPLQYKRQPNRPGDGYLWERMTAFMKAHDLISSRICVNTIVYDKDHAHQVLGRN